MMYLAVGYPFGNTPYNYEISVNPAQFLCLAAPEFPIASDRATVV